MKTEEGGALEPSDRITTSVDVGQAEVAAGVAVGEGLVVEAEEVEDRGVEVVDVDLVLDGLEAELVGGAVDVAAS